MPRPKHYQDGSFALGEQYGEEYFPDDRLSVLPYERKQHFCQWPFCQFVATTRMRRGEKMQDVYVCNEHAGDFRRVSNFTIIQLNWQEARFEYIR